MAMPFYSYLALLTLLVSPYRAGLTVDEARRLLEAE